ncbi:MAG: hypothetical protein JWN38_676 [Candidatus Saccharibacteria bacterium]|nr:hypothetical protein [Candidatus Saccharibacteria bacterium]
MTGLETAYYIIAIVFMGLFLLITIGIAIGIAIISSKISALHHQIDEKISHITNFVEKGQAVVGAIKKVTGKSNS